MSCPKEFTNLTWPSCSPNSTKGIYDCLDPKFTGNCCLSPQTKDNLKSNCPPGFQSKPDKGEWCMESWWFGNNQYRHKCQRLMCGDRYCTPDEKCGLNSTCVRTGDYSSVKINFVQPNPYTSTLIINWTAFPYPLDLNVDKVSFLAYSPINEIKGNVTPANSKFNVQDGSWKTTLTGVNLAPNVPYNDIQYRLTLNVNGNTTMPMMFNVSIPHNNPNNPDMF